MLVDSFAFAFAGAIVGVPEFAEEEVFKASVVEGGEFFVDAA